MRRSSMAIVAVATLGLATLVHAQQRAPAPASSSGVNVGSLSCNVAGGAGFVFGSSKALSCIFTRTDGSGARYVGEVRRFGIDIGYTKEAQIVWLVFAPGNVAVGALAGSYAGPTVQGTVVVGAAANVLVGGNNGRSASSRSASKAASASAWLAAWPNRPEARQVVPGSSMRPVFMLACFATACAYAQRANAEGTGGNSSRVSKCRAMPWPNRPRPIST